MRDRCVGESHTAAVDHPALDGAVWYMLVLYAPRGLHFDEARAGGAALQHIRPDQDVLVPEGRFEENLRKRRCGRKQLALGFAERDGNVAIESDLAPFRIQIARH